MSYYSAGGGGYYMAGFSLRKFARRAVKLVGKASSLATKVSPYVTAFNPALGTALGTIGGVGSRVHSILSPLAAPAGMPYEGAPALGPLQKGLSQSMPEFQVSPIERIPYGALPHGGPPGIHSAYAYARPRRSRRRRRY